MEMSVNGTYSVKHPLSLTFVPSRPMTRLWLRIKHMNSIPQWCPQDIWPAKHTETSFKLVQYLIPVLSSNAYIQFILSDLSPLDRKNQDVTEDKHLNSIHYNVSEDIWPATHTEWKYSNYCQYLITELSAMPTFSLSYQICPLWTEKIRLWLRTIHSTSAPQPKISRRTLHLPPYIQT
jgi:hypothetical protein